MPIPIDDLVASLTTSFKSNHIGQEASDLAALQTQLTQTLTSSYHSSAHNLHPNTPTQTTASWSFPPPKRRRAGQRSRAHSITQDADEMMLIDEEEVEQLLQVLNSPADSSSSPSYHPADYQNHQTQQRILLQHQPNQHQQYTESPVSPTASFAATDPFYATVSPRNHTTFQGQQSQTVIAPQSAFFHQPQPLHANQS